MKKVLYSEMNSLGSLVDSFMQNSAISRGLKKATIFKGIGILGIIATLITGFTAFHNTTNDFRWPFMVVGILLSVIIMELAVNDESRDSK